MILLLFQFILVSFGCEKGDTHPLEKGAREALSHIKDIDFSHSMDNPRVLSSMRKKLGQACVQKIQESMDKGSLFSQAVYDRSYALGDLPLRGANLPAHRFYHWTNHEGLIAQFQPHLKDRKKAHEKMDSEGIYQEIFEFSRSQYETHSDSTVVQTLFVASDPESSKHKGRTRITLDLDPRARVLVGSADLGLLNYVKWLQGMEVDLPRAMAREFPSIDRVCNFRDHLFDLLPAFLEASGVTVFAYQAFNSGYWFTLHGPGAIMRSEVGP